jgi:hypothetical protein
MSLFVPDVFGRLHDDEFFVQNIYRQYVKYIQDHGFIGTVSRPKLLEAHIFWKEDMARIKQFELVDSSTVDEYKQCGHLAYWLRRFNPISELRIYEAPENEAETKRQDFFKKYGSQFTSFMIGFDLCVYAASNAEGSPFYMDDFQLSADYTHIVSHFLKSKDVSPHSMFLIYKSLFMNPFTGKRFETLVQDVPAKPVAQ